MFQWVRLLNLDVFFVVIVVVLFIYFLVTKKKKKYEFIGWNKDINLDDILRPRVKPKRKKRKFNKGEERCREIFTSIFGKKFKSVRPDWLKNPATGQNLELDGFCPDIQTSMGTGLAFEYDGRQHATYTPHFHRGGPKEFIYQTKKDAFKTMMCKKRGIMLIRIPHSIVFEDLDRFIRMKIQRAGINI